MQPKRSTLALRPPPKNADAFVLGKDVAHAPSVERLAPAAEAANAERPASSFSDEASAPGVQRSAPDVESLALNVERSALDANDSAPNVERPTPNADRPAPDVDTSALSPQRSTSSVGRSVAGTRAGVPSSGSQRSALDVERSAPTPPSRPARRSTSEQSSVATSVERSTPVPSFSRGSKAVIERKKGAMRRTSVYLQMATATDLAEYCQGEDVEMSAVVDEAVRFFLAHRKR